MANAIESAADQDPRPKYYEMDGARLANANRAWVLAFLCATLALVALGFAIAVRLTPLPVIGVDRDGTPTVLGKSHLETPQVTGTDEFLNESFVRRFLSSYLNYGPSNVDDRWASALNLMTRNLRATTLKALSDDNTRGKIDDDQIQSVFHLREISPVAGEPLTFLIYGVKDVHHLVKGSEVTDHFVNEYRIRVIPDRRSETNPDGLWIAEYSERPIDGERRDQILAAPDRSTSDQ